MEFENSKTFRRSHNSAASQELKETLLPFVFIRERLLMVKCGINEHAKNKKPVLKM